MSDVMPTTSGHGVMKKPVVKTARKSIWVVAGEVALMNLLLAVCMVAFAPARQGHTEDMLAYIAGESMGPWGEWPVRIVGGLLLLSAANTAINGLMSICYVMSRDGEMPSILQKLNGFGAPWVAAILATVVPICVLLFAHDLATLASLYAIGVVGAVAINCVLCSMHPRLRRPWRKIAVMLLGTVMIAIWFTLAWTKWHATVFVSIVMVVGLLLRALTKYAAARRPKLSLLRQAIVDQITPEAWSKPKLLLATAGSSVLAQAAVQHARAQDATLVVSFVREVALNFTAGVDERMNIDTDPAAQTMIVDFLEMGAKYGVPIIPTYDTGPDAAILIAEAAAGNDPSLNTADWMGHWRVTWVTFLVFDCLAAFAGLSFVLQRKWALPFWATLITVFPVVLLAMTILGRYPFQKTALAEFAAMAAIAGLPSRPPAASARRVESTSSACEAANTT